MLLSCNWLTEFVPNEVPVDELAHRLTMAGIEVDEIIRLGDEFDRVCVGEIIDIAPHPNADKLRLARVAAGDQHYRVVCGAPNIAVGQKIALATAGAQLPGGLKIKRSKIRGEASEGMICSETELGIGQDSNGIMVLDSALASGRPLAQALGLQDTMLSLGITPNRADCFSMIGLAREVAAICHLPLQLPPVPSIAAGMTATAPIRLTNDAPELCPRYCGRVLTALEQRPTPLWMRRRLAACDIRPISLIVDITNYVLLEWGHPLHAFDVQRIREHQIIVRRAQAGETITTLDQQQRALAPGMLLIADPAGPLALAGVMGGLDSAVSAATRSVFLESALFAPTSIARTTADLKLKTEASERFKKGVDPAGLLPALHRATELLCQLAGAQVDGNLHDCSAAPAPVPAPITLNLAHASRTLGMPIADGTARDVLQRLQMQVSEPEPGTFAVIPPSFRQDIEGDIDLIEELARIIGYDQIPTTYPQARLHQTPQGAGPRLAALLRRTMAGRGFREAINYSFVEPAAIQALRFDADDPRATPVALLTPLSTAQSVLRTSLLTGLLGNLRDNCNNKAPSVRLYEIGRIFTVDPQGPQPCEKRSFAAVAHGLRFEESWNQPRGQIDFFDLKGVVEDLLAQLHITDYSCSTAVCPPYLYPGRMLSIFLGDGCLGSLGMLHPDTAERFDLSECPYVFELDFTLLSSYYQSGSTYQPFSRQPSITRDMALIVNQDVSAATIRQAIDAFGHKHITGCDIFDVYTGSGVAEDKKSIAFRITFQAAGRTLTDKEVNQVRDNLVSWLTRETGAVLR